MGMERKVARVVGCALVLCAAFRGAAALACMDYRPRPAGLVYDVLSNDPAVARAAAEKLRAMGPEGLGVLMDVYEREIRRHTGRPVGRPSYTPTVFEAAMREGPDAPDHSRRPAALRSGTAETWERLSAAIDAVAAQKDAAYAGLYWHTDLEAAKAAAKASGRPILSLRLLGTLVTEFSCANSRFFRTVLYANAEVSAALRERFVLHWQSVRPVPKVTIDMGDGRVIERTITGNSIHYVLAPDGRPVDAAPGLYGPKAFLRLLDEAAHAATKVAAREGAEAKQRYLAEWHAARAERVAGEWEQDLAQVSADGARAAALSAEARLVPANGAAPTALRASRAAFSKSAAEVPIVRALETRVAALTAATDDGAWAKIAALPKHAEDARLDAGSQALLRRKHAGPSAGPSARAAGALSLAKRQQEDPLARVVAGFERSVAEDTVRNEYRFHRTIHEWFASGAPETRRDDVSALNERVYAELFLTPSTDPWLGLVPEDAYAALEGGGRVLKN